jgi:multiple sugar transport system ATP-binding protein
VNCRADGLSIGAAVKLGIRPEHIRPVDTGSGDVALAVTLTEQLGGESYLHGTTPSGEALSVRLPGQTRVTRGETVGLVLGDPTSRRLFDATSEQALAQIG